MSEMATITKPVEFLAANVRARLELLGWSYADLADRCGIHAPKISRICNAQDDVRISTVEKLAEALGCGSDELLHPPRAAIRENLAETA